MNCIYKENFTGTIEHIITHVTTKVITDAALKIQPVPRCNSLGCNASMGELYEKSIFGNG